MRRFLILITASALLSCIGDGDSPTGGGSHVGVGDRVPAFELPGITSPDDFVGRKTLLVFFVTTCSDCRRELPFVDYAHRNIDALTVRAIGRGESQANVTAFWNELGLDHSISPAIDPDKRVYNLFAEHTVPRLYLVDELGTVVWTAVENLGYGEFTPAKGEAFNTLIKNNLNL